MVLHSEGVTQWLGCDACGKWRSVPQSLVDALPKDAKWYCADNPNREFASCDAPQELSDDEIDRITVATGGGAGEAHGSQAGRGGGGRPAVWQHTSANIFTHRTRKVEGEDDIMVCQCTPPADGGPGCGEDCLNRMLNQECNPEYCPCGAQCSNTQFASRRYADIESRRAGRKGFGLFTNEPLRAGQFIIEYVGEVLEEEEYMRRKVWYQECGQRHYYFMNTGNGEVIDACRKGGLGRFINHSCDPNCETQKWVVGGELAIGLFALKDCPADEELTFDYNFERYGDKALRCYCAAASCRGYIGGTPEEHEVDKDLEENEDCSLDPEPIMVAEAEAAANPACQAILAHEVGLAPADWRDGALRRGWEQLAEKYGLQLDWEEMARGLPAAAAAEGEAAQPAAEAPASLAAVEQKLLERRGQTRLLKTVPPRKRLTKGDGGGTPSGSGLGEAGDLGPLLSHSSAKSQRQPPLRGFRRRSEVDRRLDSLVAPSGRLREQGTAAVVRMLRLFNLCDVGTLPPAQQQPQQQQPKAETSQQSSASAGPVSSGEGHSADTAEPRSKRPRLERETGELSPGTSSGPEREDGEIGEQHAPLPPRGGSAGQANGGGSYSHATGGGGGREAGQLTSRQRARMADVSLLLDVILKTTATSARQAFCRCGVLRQLQSVLGRCGAGSQFEVIVKKVLRAVEHLPLTADDLHQHSSAHGSFANTLWTLGGHADFEIRTKARALRERFPPEACSREVQEAARAARQAAAARRARHDGFSGSFSGGFSGGFPGGFRRRWGAPEPGQQQQQRPASARAWASQLRPLEEAPTGSGGKGAQQRRRRESRWGPLPAGPPSAATPAGMPGSEAPGSRGLHRLHASSGSLPDASGAWQQGPRTASPVRRLTGFSSGPQAQRPFGSAAELHAAPPPDALSPRVAPALPPPPRLDGSPVTPPGSPPPQSLPPPPPVPLAGQPPPPRLPGASPVSPPTASGAYMGGSDEEGLQHATANGRGAHEGNGGSWTAPPWQAAGNGRTGGGAALAAPLPLHGWQMAGPGEAAQPSGSLPPGLGPANGRTANGGAADAGAAGGRSPSPGEAPPAFERPDAAFDEWVGRLIARRLGKYKQPEHPSRIGREDFRELYKKATKAIIDAERKAYGERQRAGAPKQIETGKLEARVKDFVRELVRRLHDRQAGRA